MNIKTEYWAKPIPSRNCDWSAIDDDTYDGAEDSFCPIGYGATEQEAIDQLKEMLDLCPICDKPVDCDCTIEDVLSKELK
jgi:hypothetical protein